MKITEKRMTDEEVEDRDGRTALEIWVDDVCDLSFRDGEPEDATLYRDFSDCYSIIDLLKRVYTAGWKQEEISFEQEPLTEN